MKTNASLKLHRSGFSLLEMIVVMGIIGVIVLGAIATTSSIIGQSKATAGISNARHLADVANLAIAAGSEPLLAAASKEDVVDLLRSGVYGDGQFAATHFQVALGQDEAVAALSRLSFANGVLSFGDN
jgi:prepilin-type N-terminal cleavage/methylation domain-containing protein